MSTLHAIVPAGIDDPARPSGGNRYGRRLLNGLAEAGWEVREHAVPGDWPDPDARDRARLAELLDRLPEGALLLVDGLIGSAAEALVPAARRLSLVVLVHLPLGESHPAERSVLDAAAGLLTTSGWTRDWLVEHYRTDPRRVVVARPGADPAPPAPAGAAGDRLLCVANVTPGKGHDVLVEAESLLVDRPWRCTLVGSLSRDPECARRLTEQIRRAGLESRIALVGARTGAALEASYAVADLVLLPSRFESYGMVVTEALARGLPVIGSDVGGLPEALGRTAAGDRPGILVPPGDPGALAEALRCWLTDASLRASLRARAADRRASLPGWASTVARVGGLLGSIDRVPA